jgi:hypothetical protein
MNVAPHDANWCSPKGSSTSWHLTVREVPIRTRHQLAPVGTSAAEKKGTEKPTPSRVILNGECTADISGFTGLIF